MTLSNFLRDYLYIALGGNRVGTARRFANLMITMLLAGLWHGASWTFVLFGGMHGLFLVINTWWRRLNIPLPTALAWALTFVAVVTSFVLFRAPSFERALLLLGDLAGLGGFAWDSAPYSVGRHEWKRILPLLAVVLLAPNRQQIMSWRWRSDWAYALAFSLLMGVSILRMGNPQPFYYFQF
jgi:alginate O-acetyltransferase complex protein AlgI